MKQVNISQVKIIMMLERMNKTLLSVLISENKIFNIQLIQ